VLDPAVFAARRDALMARLGPKATLVVSSLPERLRNGDAYHVFRQASDVYYLTGFVEPETTLVLRPGADSDRCVMFVRPRDPEHEVWDGKRAGLEGAKERYGADAAYSNYELRAKLPDNLYWELDAPTKDPEVLQKRAEAQRKWNELFGKVQSGDATEEEIHRYYDHRRKLSEDYLAVANLMLSEYGSRLPESDKGLIELSIRMHQDRLAEVPRQEQEAFARKQLQDQRREEWIRNGKKP